MLRQSRLFVGPEHVACLVVGVAVQSRRRVEGALIGDADLVDSVVVDFLCLFLWQQVAGGHRIERQAHKDAVEPYLIGIDSLVPVDLVNHGAWLVLQLLHHQLHGQQVFLLGPLLVHAGHKMARADIVQIVVLDIESADVAVGIDHSVGILLAVLAYLLAAIAQVGVKHTFQLDTHHIAPFGSVREVEQV